PSLEITPRPRPLLARQVVRYAGEPLAIVVAEDRYQAHDALAVIEAELDPLPALAGIERAAAAGDEHLAGSTELRYGDIEAAFAPAVPAPRLGRPAAWVGSRSDDTASTTQAHGTVLDLELAADPEGGLRGLRGYVLQDVGAYTTSGSGSVAVALAHLRSAYRLP